MVVKMKQISCVGLMSLVLWLKCHNVNALFDPSLFNDIEEVEDVRITYTFSHASRKRSISAIDEPSAITTTIESDHHDVTLTFTKSKRNRKTQLLYKNKQSADQGQTNKCLSAYEDETNTAHAVVDTCGNRGNSLHMMAEVYIEGDIYVILPNQPSDLQTKHGLFKVSPLAYNLTGDSVEPEKRADTYAKPRATRFRRQSETYTVELVIVIDYSLYQYWRGLTTGTEAERDTQTDDYIEKYYTLLANGINARYNSLTTYDLNINVELVGIYVTKTQEEIAITSNADYAKSTRGELDGKMLLVDFKNWVESQTDLNFPAGADHYMLVTGHEMSLDGNQGAAGYANTAAICSANSVSLMDVRLDLLSGVIGAHELGHSLGALHDGTITGCSDSDFYILATTNSARTGSNRKNPWLFSQCSADSFKATIAGLTQNCLLTDDLTSLAPATGAGIGQSILPDKQCELIVGTGYEMSRSTLNGNYNEMCTGIYCAKSGVNEQELIIPSDGTTCGDKKWCLNGDCVTSPDAPSGDETCLFGDQPSGDRANRLCADMVTADKAQCYNSDVYISCCASCAGARVSNVTGCEYGDASDCNVKAAQCYGSGNRASCCFSCLQYERADLPEDCKYGDRVGNCAQVPNACTDYPSQCCAKCNTQTTKKMTTKGTSSNTTGDDGQSVEQTTKQTTTEFVFTTRASKQTELPEWIIPVVASVGGVVFLGLMICLISYILKEQRSNKRNKRDVRRRGHERRYDNLANPYDKYSLHRY